MEDKETGRGDKPGRAVNWYLPTTISIGTVLPGQRSQIHVVIHVETVDLDARNVRLPSDRVGMVVAQPYVPDASLTPAEPYQCADHARAQRLAEIAATLTVSRDRHHGLEKTHFTIFPEYTVPGPAGIALIDDAVRAENWPSGTIVIGGTDGLTHEQYRELVQPDSTHCDTPRTGADQIGDRWVNCAITWVKNTNGSVERWVQPKIYPALPEMNVPHQHMFQGRSVYVFKGRFENNAPFRFASLICFDWIATIGANTPFQWILSDVHTHAGDAQLPMSWMFVIQRNKKPSHDAFLNGVNRFFNQVEFPNALRERACVVFANTAGKAVPGRSQDFGGGSVVSSPQSLFTRPDCIPTVSAGGPRFRNGSTLLAPCKDLVFRERGACIHSFVQVNPASVNAGAAGRVFAVDRAHVFPTTGPAHPRAPNASVPAAVKWINDELDDLPNLQVRHALAPLSAAAAATHTDTVAALRGLSSQAGTMALTLAAQDSQAKHADDWDAPESDALGHVTNTLDILTLAFAPPAPNIVGQPVHASLDIANQSVDVIAVRGNTHDECIAHIRKVTPPLRRQTLIVSRDHENTKWAKRLGSFLNPPAQPGDEPKITDPTSGMLHLGYQNLLERFLGAQNAAGLAASIHAELAA